MFKMRNRTLIGDLEKRVGNYVTIAGWVDRLRDQKKMQFLICRDHTGYVQVANFKDGKPLDELVSSLTPDTTVVVGGNLVVNPQVKLNGYEIQLDCVDIKSRPEGTLPITSESSLDSRLDWRYIDLRDPKKHLIFRIQTTAEYAMREFWFRNGFTEIHSPKLVEGASESGAELFWTRSFTSSIASIL